MIRDIDLSLLNSMTKYPSIPTYHTLDPTNGRLMEPVVPFGNNLVIGTEKVDGTNARIILLPDGNYIIGSREELLHAKGDLIANPTLGIVKATVEAAEGIAANLNFHSTDITIFYVEVFGGNIGKAAKQYSAEGMISLRLFDVGVFVEDQWKDLFNRSREEIAAWRYAGKQDFYDEIDLLDASLLTGIKSVPRLFEIEPEIMPVSIEHTAQFLRECLPHTHCTLDDGAGGSPEGIVFRTIDRKIIAKARFQDYARTLKSQR